jgi:RNA polymerase sigma-70 factor (family 1)
MGAFRLEILPDEKLLALIREDDYAAFTEVYNRYWKVLMRTAAKRLGSLEAAEEIVQNIFLHLFLRRKELVIETSLESYLHGAVRHQVFKNYRAIQTQLKYIESTQLQEPQHVESPDAALEVKELREQVLLVANKMPEKCREVFFLSRFDQLSHKEIAERLGISVNTVKRHMTKALSILQKEMPHPHLWPIVTGIIYLSSH